MRITSPLGGDRGQQEPLIMMGGHMPQESPVDDWVAPDPWQFRIVCGEQRGGRNQPDYP
jgi:hypothetical protein